MHGDGFGCLHTEDISGHISSCSRSLFLPARVLSFVLLSRVSSCSRSFSSCSRSFFRPFISRFFLLEFFLFFLPAHVLFFFLLAFFLSSFYLAFRPARVLFFRPFISRSFFCPFISRFVLLAFFFFLLAFFLFFLPARVLSFLSSCSRSFFRPFISRFLFLPARVFFFFLLAFFLSSFYLAFFLFFLPARIHFSQQIPLQNLHISKICCTFALKFKYTSTRLVEY